MDEEQRQSGVVDAHKRHKVTPEFVRSALQGEGMEKEEVESFIIVSSRLIYTKLAAEEGGAIFPFEWTIKICPIRFHSILQTSEHWDVSV